MIDYSYVFTHSFGEIKIIVYASTTSESGGNELVALNSCTCEGYDQVYECRITGGGTLVWKGSAFDCPSTGNEIILVHGNSRSNDCNDGAIVGGFIRAENSTYIIAQLTVSVSAEMVGLNISCYHDSVVGDNLIGSTSLALTTGDESII